MRAISWFAGIGGFDLALRRAGVEVVGACEIEPSARRIYEARLGVPGWWAEDIRTVEADEVPDAELWCGGFPCQDLSVAGRRAGIDGERSGLIWKLLDLAAVRRPTWILLENVPGLLSGKDGEDEVDEGRGDGGVDGGADGLVRSWFGALLGALADLGYMGAWRVLDAQHFGVPQRRRRVFILARLGVGDGADPGAVLAVGEGGGGDHAAGAAARAGAAGGAAGGAGVAGRGVAYNIHSAESCARQRHAYETNHTRCLDSTGGFATQQGGTLVVQPYVKVHRGGVVYQCHGSNVGPMGTMRSGNQGDQGGGSEALVAYPDPAYALADNSGNRTGSGRDGQDTFVAYVKRRRAASATDAETWSEGEVAPTLSTHDGAHSDVRATTLVAPGVRRLTPVECERLQGFPDWWTCVCGAPGSWETCACADGPRYRALGNAVAVPVVEWIVRRLVGVTHSPDGGRR